MHALAKSATAEGTLKQKRQSPKLYCWANIYSRNLCSNLLIDKFFKSHQTSTDLQRDLFVDNW